MKKRTILNRGFTFVEIIMIIAILAILSVIGIPKYIDLTALSKQRVEEAVIASIQIGIITEQAKNQLE